MFTRAIVRPPAPNFAQGLTTAGLGAPDYERALEQHEAYCAALARCGLTVTRLEPDPNHPDSTFVEDTAIVTTNHCAVLTRPGAPSRAGEVERMGRALAEFFPNLSSIGAPGTVDGGDVCEAGSHFFIGLSQRTNEAGAQHLTELLAPFDYTCSLVDIREERSLLHLKSGIAYLGNNRLVVTEAIAGRAEFAGYNLVIVDSAEAYAANCVSVNDFVLVAAGHPIFEGKLPELGYQTIALEMTEFQKMDGGLSCLSLRF
ncbi:MAG: N(G),N(G)-dimethylarginine dimethylaminohydrolase [Blastocatellia bacterium]|nr:N(G),N(G)-dimethylarginine dimethylaminohydrolase [Blastocatellia bacterium]